MELTSKLPDCPWHIHRAAIWCTYFYGAFPRYSFGLCNIHLFCNSANTRIHTAISTICIRPILCTVEVGHIMMMYLFCFFRFHSMIFWYIQFVITNKNLLIVTNFVAWVWNGSETSPWVPQWSANHSNETLKTLLTILSLTVFHWGFFFPDNDLSTHKYILRSSMQAF